MSGHGDHRMTWLEVKEFTAEIANKNSDDASRCIEMFLQGAVFIKKADGQVSIRTFDSEEYP